MSRRVSELQEEKERERTRAEERLGTWIVIQFL